ncbi:MAG: AmmeMemoRadiSam system radical SAM enzyme [Calditrichaeota bacterium]|nr:MAG: AmmeMemoRadiSam system radical SAM enzyme [Calditrichota bacterium]MBL1204636.1 AmmeMemoRadiSam system radical SAM enzyme [Calditrichota bacterium]NOG44464.1 AmmeMemoRadiSam system radical SAM enzyme [Calditrichota bacterium]
MKLAQFFKEIPNNKVHCYLCPRDCKIGEGQTGFCFIRKNIGGKLYNLAYGKPYAVHIDPIEKKPLFHFLPGTDILSIGTAGCNLGCKFCQNWDISKAKYDQDRAGEFMPETAVQSAIRNNCSSIAYTYNDPTIWAEYAMDIAKLARQNNLKNVMVTAGYIALEVIPEVYENMDAANIDLKAFTEEFYHKITLSHLQPVLDAIKELKNLGIWIEITNLVIPTQNDDMQEISDMCKWILDNLGNEIPIHFSAFHPDFKMTHLDRTPIKTLEKARAVAQDCGLLHVYTGNVLGDGSNTYCPNCDELLIKRDWHAITENNLINKECPGCGYQLKIIQE